MDTSLKGYNLYRSATSFTEIGQADKVNTDLFNSTSYNDLPDQDGEYFYRVTCVSMADNESALSNEASALSDSIPPRAVTIEYTPHGNHDVQSGRTAAGSVDVLITLLWGPAYLVWAVGCLGTGTLIYLLYARNHYIEAQEGITVFKPPLEERAKVGYRVLVPIADPESAGKLLGIASDLAQTRGGDVVALHVVTVSEPVPLEAGRWRAGSVRIRAAGAPGGSG